MKDFTGKVAVVTGAASGIGLALATRFAQEGMRVVMADVEEPVLEASVTRLRQQEHDVLGVVTDVSSSDSVEALRDKALEAYSKVHILCNNAGVSIRGAGNGIWGATLKDWQWGMGVNLWGVIHGVRAFVPGMIEHGEEGHIVYTASTAGLLSGGGIYGLTKHAVVAFSEGLHHDLARVGSRLHCSVLCPGVIRTNIVTATRNRPDELLDDSSRSPTPEAQERTQILKDFIEQRGTPPEDLANVVLDAVKEDRFWILESTAFDTAIRSRVDSIINRTNPVLPDIDFPR